MLGGNMFGKLLRQFEKTITEDEHFENEAQRNRAKVLRDIFTDAMKVKSRTKVIQDMKESMYIKYRDDVIWYDQMINIYNNQLRERRKDEPIIPRTVRTRKS